MVGVSSSVLPSLFVSTQYVIGNFFLHFIFYVLYPLTQFSGFYPLPASLLMFISFQSKSLIELNIAEMDVSRYSALFMALLVPAGQV